MSKIAVVYHSGYGHTAVLAEAVKEGAMRVPGTQVAMVKVEDVEKEWETLNGAEALIFGSPTYMGSASAPFTAFMDASSKIWAKQLWKDKVAAGFTNSSSQSGDKLNTLVQMMIFAMQHGMVWIGLGQMAGNNSSVGTVGDINRLGSFAGAMAQSNSDQGPEATPPAADKETAALLGERVAMFASRLED